MRKIHFFMAEKSKFTLHTRGLLAVVLALGIISASIQPAQATSYYARDDFATVAYTNNDGTVNWVGNWTEQGDDNAAATGEFLMTGGWLRIQDTDNNTANEGIYRVVDLSSAASATLSFYYRNSNNLEATDTVVVEISNNGGTTYPVTLFTSAGVNQPNATRFTVTIPAAYRVANARIRFRVSNDYAAWEYFEFDNVEVAYVVGGTHTATSVLKTVQIYYVPIPEDQGLQALAAINTAAVSPMFLYVSITVPSDGTVIYYDHWEDGFETTVNNPAQISTDVWGDNNPANGMPPGYSTDILNAGDIIVLNNVIDVTGGVSSAVIKYDGGDKIASTEAIAVTRTAWPSGAGTLHGGSVEMLDTSVWGLRYDIPVDDTVPAFTPNADFEYTGLTVMASQDDTEIYRNGTLVTTINEGQSYMFTDGNVAIGDVITADKPVQANLLVGDIGSNYASSWYTLYPFERLSSSYYAPVSSNRRPDTTLINTAVVVHNPNDSAITVGWETSSGAQTDISVAAHSYGRVIVPENTAARFYTADDSRFQALSVIDTGGQAHDWGYTLIPANQLTQQVKVGWGAGRDPTSATNPSENGSPIWVTAVGSGTLYVCADYNGDSLGALTDSNGWRYDQLITLTTLQRARIYDSDGDQSGMLLYLCNGSQNNYDSKIAAAWGQDPATANTAAPGLDVGTAVPPLPNFTAIKGAELTGDVNGDGKFDLGDTFEYQIVIKNTGALPIPSGMITVKDIVPQYTVYVTNSTRLDGVLIPDDISGTAFPLDDAGYTISQTMPIEGQFIVTFRVTIDDDLPTSTTIRNEADVSGLSLTYLPIAEIIVDPPTKIGDLIWFDLDGDGVQDADEPGIPGVTVWLYDSTGTTLLATAVTNAQGLYTFSGLSANTNYIVRVNPASLPGGMTQTGDPDSSCPGTGCDDQHLASLGTTPYWNADFGYQGNVTIGDFVWYDADGDGVQDGGIEVGLDGVTVSLTWAGPDGVLDTADDVAFTQVTANGGAYTFAGLSAGTYRVDVDDSTLPANYALVTTDPLTYTNVTAGTAITNADFGALPGASIGDFVWHDIDGDGVQDTGEGGIAGGRVFVDRDGDGVWDSGEWYAITDANGAYLITHIPPGTYTVRLDTNTIPAGYSLTTANPLTGIVVVANQVYQNADFGLQAAVLGIVKTSSANGQVQPGDTIYYTLTVRNNTAIAQTGVSVLDDLPAGTTYVTQSTVAQGFVLSTSTADYLHTFENGISYSGSQGSINWTTSWVEYDTDGGSQRADQGNIRIVNDATNCPVGNRCLRFELEDINDYIYRQADLTVSACGSASPITLQYDYNNALGGASDQLQVRIYTGNTQRRTVATYTSNNQGSGSVSFPLAADEIAANTQIWLLRIGDNDDYFFYIDNVRFVCSTSTPAAATLDNDPVSILPALVNGTPPNLAVAGDNLVLDPTQQMQVTYRVTVNDPVSLESIDNTASVFSAQQLVAQQASTCDFLPARIGDRVWLDRDNDGIQDADESGIRGVTVTLTIAYPDGTSTPLTTVTDRDGYYSFADLFLDSAYSFADSGATFSLSFTTPPGMTASSIGQGSNTATDSNGAVTTAAPFSQGRTDLTYDSGFTTQRLDLGDLPDTYRTYFSPGPAHIVFPDTDSDGLPNTTDGRAAVWLGYTIDGELDGQPTAYATGDGDDEDGLLAPPTVEPGSTTTFMVTINASQSSVTVYFGVWIDWDQDGIFDAFYPGSGLSGSPRDVLVSNIAVPATYTPGSPVFIRVRAANFELSSEDSTGTIINGEVEDYREDWTPTAVTLASFAANLQDDAILVTWETAMELDNVGFNLYRSTAAAGPYTQLNTTIIPPQFPGEVMGGYYEWLDKDALPGVVYYYRLEDIDVNGVSTFHGPVSAALPGVAETRNFIYLPFVSRNP
jgi:uncharacterized repeat protein (TIGR01451 family)